MENVCEYVWGLEPGNCNPVGRKAQEEKGALETLRPWGEKKVELVLGVAEGREEIEALTRIGG